MVGTGIFTATAFFAGDLGAPTLVMWLWVAGAACALLGAICYSELGVNFPSSGGEYVYLTRAFGPTWGFMDGWVSFFAGFSAAIAAASLAFTDYVGHFFPAVSPENAHIIAGAGEWTFRLGGAQLLAGTMIVAFSIVNILGVRRVARVQSALTGAKVVVIVAFIVVGFLAGDGSVANFTLNAARKSQ